jgi:hypothetical protein
MPLRTVWFVSVVSKNEDRSALVVNEPVLCKYPSRLLYLHSEYPWLLRRYTNRQSRTVRLARLVSNVCGLRQGFCSKESLYDKALRTRER